jgi:hypothetical protein
MLSGPDDLAGLLLGLAPSAAGGGTNPREE